jgi:hypothetical protein
VRVVWESTIYGGKAPIPCVLCGQRFHPLRLRTHLYLLAVVYNDHNRMVGESCRDCLRSGAEGIRTHLSERLQQLEKQVEELQTLAQEEIYLPSLEEEFQAYS